MIDARFLAPRELVTRRERIRTSSPMFDDWYSRLGRIHPCAEFEENADQFVIGDLVDAFNAGRESMELFTKKKSEE